MGWDGTQEAKGRHESALLALLSKQSYIFQLDEEGNLKVSDKNQSFDADKDTTVSIVTVGTVKTITESDGTKTLTTTIDLTDENNISISSVWS